jgi:hypothetical protein
MTIPCQKQEDICEIKTDVKEIKNLLTQHLVEQAVIKHKIDVHERLWNGSLIGAVGVIGYFIKGWLEKRIF